MYAIQLTACLLTVAAIGVLAAVLVAWVLPEEEARP